MNDDEDEEDPSHLLAQRMGFTSFGARPPPKKRKPNPAADGAGGGSNQLPLGDGRNAGKHRAEDATRVSRRGADARCAPANVPGEDGPGECEGEEGEPDWRALRRGVRDGNGDVAYFDRSFVEDPWAELMGGCGLREGLGLGRGGGD